MQIPQHVKVYGFGSFFKKHKNYRDIDILIIHQDISRDSCIAALKLKKEFIKLYANVDITMLSANEEKSFDFISKSQAEYLGCIFMSDIATGIKNITTHIGRLRPD